MKIRVEVSSIASKHRSGVAQYTKLLVDALTATKGVDTYVHYFNFLGRQPKPQFTNKSLITNSNKVMPLKVYAKAQSYGLAPAFDFLLSKVDLTIFPNFATWPAIKSKCTATVIHDLTYLYYPEVVEKKNLAHLRRVVPRSVKKADFIITVSESVKSEIVKEFGIDPSKCLITPIPPDKAFFRNRSIAEISAVKEKYGIKPDNKYIYFIGNLEPRKNLKSLIEAYQLLPNKIRQEYSLILAGGKGWKTDSTQAALNSALEKGENIKHVGFVDQVDSPALFQGASLFVMPSLYEGFGMPVLEAMACGTKVLANDIPVLKEVGADCASYTDASNPKRFAQSINAALGKKSNKSKLRKNVLRYSWNENIQKIIDKTNELDG